MERILNIKHKLVLSMAIGDGYITKNGKLIIVHCEKQKEYLEFKHSLLVHAGIKCYNVTKINNNGFPAYKLETSFCEEILDIRKLLYNTKKVLTTEVLEHLTPEGIALWYLDDGGLSKKYKNGVLSCNELMLNTGLQKEENLVIIDWFKYKYNINFSQCKNHNCYRLRCGTKEARKLMDIIYPTCAKVQCLSYKIDVKDYQYSVLDQAARSAEVLNI